jgi:hypothetical protein
LNLLLFAQFFFASPQSGLDLFLHLAHARLELLLAVFRVLASGFWLGLGGRKGSSFPLICFNLGLELGDGFGGLAGLVLSKGLYVALLL